MGDQKITSDFDESSVKHECMLKESNPTERKIQELKEMKSSLLEHDEEISFVSCSSAGSRRASSEGPMQTQGSSNTKNARASRRGGGAPAAGGLGQCNVALEAAKFKATTVKDQGPGLGSCNVSAAIKRIKSEPF